MMPHTSDSGRPGAIARLAREDWHAMTEAANRGRWDRWLRLAREANPALGDTQVERLAAHLQSEHCRKMAKLSADARRIKRELAAGLKSAGDDETQAGAA